MAAIHHYREAVGATVAFDVPLEAQIRAGEIGLATDAILASGAACGVVVDDAEGSLEILGKQRWEVDEDEAPAEATLTGTLAKTASSTTIVGTGTTFLTDVAEADELVIGGGGGTDYLFVESITDNTHLEVYTAPAYSSSGETVIRAGRQRMWSGRTSTKRITRGRSRTEGGEILAAGRAWSIDLIERNGLLHSRIPWTSGAGGTDNWNRPAETMAARLAFIVASQLFADLEIFDDGFVVYPTFDLDKADLRGQFLDEVLNGIALASNQDQAKPARRNIGIFWHEAAGHWALWFRTFEDFAYPSPVRLTNVDADLANANTYATLENPDAELVQDPEIIASRVIVTIGRRRVVRENAAVEALYGPWDVNAPNSNLKTVTAGENYGDAELAQSDTEDETVTCRFIVPAANVNDVREFQQCRIRQTHFPGWEIERWARVVHRDIKEAPAGSTTGPGRYEVGLKLTPVDAPGTGCSFDCTPSVTNYPLGGATDFFNPVPAAGDPYGPGFMYMCRSGLIFPVVPTPGYIGRWWFKIFGSAGGGPGTVDYGQAATGNNTLRAVVVGNGTLTIQTVAYGGGAGTFNAVVKRQTTPGIPTNESDYFTTVSTTGHTTGDEVTVTVDDADGENCITIVDLSGWNGVKFGWSEADWSSAGCGGG